MPTLPAAFSRRPLLALTAVALLAVGCGSNRTYPAGGKVVFKEDGQPLTGGRVEFELETADVKARVSACGDIQSDGTFRLGTFKPGDGAVEGWHRVIVLAPFAGGDLDRLPTPRASAVLHERFADYQTSGLRFSVTRDAKKNDFVIEVERPAKPRRPG